MKITHHSNNTFLVEDKKVKIVCNPDENFDQNVEFATLSNPEGGTIKGETKKILHLPGEFEISKILVKGIFSNSRNNVIFKIVADDIAIAHLGNITELPTSQWFEKLGENVSLIMLNVSDEFDAKKAKELIEKIDPRYALVTGDAGQFPKLAEMGAQTPEDKSVNLTRASLGEDRTDILLFS